MEEHSVRIYYTSDDGEWQDGQIDYPLSSFAGVLPAVGDLILEPGVLHGKDRHDPDNREMLEVKKRVFGARDFPNIVALLVEKRKVDLLEQDLI